MERMELSPSERETVEAMLANSCRMKPAAAALYLHRNTLAGRIRTIQRRTGCDLRKCVDLFCLLEQLPPADRRELVTHARAKMTGKDSME